MSTSPNAISRIEVVYPEAPSFVMRQEAVKKGHSVARHLMLVGTIDSDAEVYADESAIDEVNIIRNLGLRVNDLLYHATSSIALPAIARHGALLSSQQILKLQEPVVTGEITTEQGWLHRHRDGLSDVYASHSPIDTGYAQVTDGHYPVIFGIDPQKLETQPSIDYESGMRLGGRVALRAIAVQIVPFDRVSQTKNWAFENCLDDTIIMSLDAAFLLTYGLGYRR